MDGEAVYGFPPPELAAVTPDARQVSPLVPGAETIEDIGDGALARFVVLAPPGTLDRRYVLAQALGALAPAGTLVALAPKTKGGARLGAELAAFGCRVREDARRHHRICQAHRPAPVPPRALPEPSRRAPRRPSRSSCWDCGRSRGCSVGDRIETPGTGSSCWPPPVRPCRPGRRPRLRGGRLGPPRAGELRGERIDLPGP